MPLRFAAFLSCLCLFACQPATPPPPQTVVVTDDLDRTLTVAQPVERVLTLAPNLTELVFAAGAGHLVPAVSVVDNYPVAVDNLPRFAVLPVDFEAIAAYRPDLVFAADQVNSPNDAPTFSDLGIPVYFFAYHDLAGMIRSLRTMGTLLDTEAVAEAAADSLQARIDSLQTLTMGLERPRILFIIGDETLYAYGKGGYTNDLISLAGGESVTEVIESPMPVLSDEFVLTAQPDVIIGAFGEAYDPQQLLEYHPTWRNLPAIQNGRVYSLHPDLLLRPGPRLVEGAWQIAQRLHPEVFAIQEPLVVSSD